jgi:carbonic anhydrase/acetyltransferase-like protein (isoleucine patch superfamily)
MNLFDKTPWVSNNSFIAPNAAVVGDVQIGDESSVWYGSVIRGDSNAVHIGSQSNIQDKAVVQVKPGTDGNGFPASTTIGDYVTIGQGAILTACEVESYAVVGAGAIVSEGALVEKHSMLEAGTVVPPGRRIPSGQVRRARGGGDSGGGKDRGVGVYARGECVCVWMILSNRCERGSVDSCSVVRAVACGHGDGVAHVGIVPALFVHFPPSWI